MNMRIGVDPNRQTRQKLNIPNEEKCCVNFTRLIIIYVHHICNVMFVLDVDASLPISIHLVFWIKGKASILFGESATAAALNANCAFKQIHINLN